MQYPRFVAALLFVCCGGCFAPSLPILSEGDTVRARKPSWLETCAKVGRGALGRDGPVFVRIEDVPRAELETSIIPNRTLKLVVATDPAQQCSAERLAEIEVMNTILRVGRIVGHLRLDGADEATQDLASLSVPFIQRYAKMFDGWHETRRQGELESNLLTLTVAYIDHHVEPHFHPLPDESDYQESVLSFAEVVERPKRMLYSPQLLREINLRLPQHLPGWVQTLIGPLSGTISFRPRWVELFNADGNALGCYPAR